MANGPRSITQTERERCRGAPGEVFRGERVPSGKLHHGVGEGESKAAQLLSGWSGSQEGIKLAL